MKVAIPYEAGQVFGHFGHSAAFMVYEIEAGKVVSSTLLPTNGSGHGALAGLLAANKVNALVCGGIGGGARTALAAAGIAVYAGVTGSADAAAAALAEGRPTRIRAIEGFVPHGDEHSLKKLLGFLRQADTAAVDYTSLEEFLNA